ncbi:uncharacterized protein LOC125502890 [Dendroctonus ponderosae]|nr:uncharacterized protein LOC109534827 [Dendroctonus ponderosae]XP_048518315.1 uncharacterized protein LOC125502890 [Dendroctonus ponderosae]
MGSKRGIIYLATSLQTLCKKAEKISEKCWKVAKITMISTRENLLCRPWQQRKYEYHKKKVLSATPVIDTKSPPHRPHVALKLKKLQKEEERSRKIERDNLMLLQKLNYIMAKHWQDNYLPPQPTFLSRIGVYRSSESGLLEALADGQDSKIQVCLILQKT